MLVCLSLFESALFSYFLKPSDENYHQMKSNIYKPSKLGAVDEGKPDAEKEKDKEKTKRVLKLHKMSRILLPTLFVMFNMVYWIYYL